MVIFLGMLPAVFGCHGNTGNSDDDAASGDDTGDDSAALDDDTSDDTADDTATDDTGADDDGDAPNQCDDLVGNLVDPEVILVHAGTFLMGSPAGEPGHEDIETQHEVTLTRDYYVMKYEVTQSLWKGVMGKMPGGQWACDVDFGVGDASWIQVVKFANALSEALGYDQCYTVTGDTAEWDQSCNGYRLPTEAEWEFAARAGAETAFYDGQITNGSCDDPLLSEIAWYCGNSGYGMQLIGQKTPNGFGIYDILGNIWEWAWDGADNDEQIPFTADPVTDPLGPGGTAAHAYRGGGMFSTAFDCRLAKRRFGRTDMQDGDTGARLVRTAFSSR